MHLATSVLTIADAESDLRQEDGHGEQIFEDPVVLRQPPYVERPAGLLPVLLHPVQGDLHWWTRKTLNHSVWVSSPSAGRTYMSEDETPSPAPRSSCCPAAAASSPATV